MEVIIKSEIMQRVMEKFRNNGKEISFVPTMGFLHDGHLSLMKDAKRKADILVVSIFVNPTQFGPNEDFDKYPRDFESDKEKCESIGVDYLFYPDVKEMYGDNFKTSVFVESLTNNLCGLIRPTHFRGVATIVAKLFNIVKPHYAIFGWKDAQQLLIIRKMVEDLNMDVEVIGAETIREDDGLAMSSRNKYLSPEERIQAVCLKKGLDLAEQMIDKGERESNKIIGAMVSLIETYDKAKIDYVKIVSQNEMKDIDKIENDNTLIAMAVYFSQTRLIDNIRI